uniref:Reverse transcriptase domain-containing protein n=1 Tax=Brassica oleracea var. oleracea TaxID=109376 RepID=A0A0D3CGC5_BRAOL
MTNLMNAGLEQIHLRLDEIQGSQPARSRTRRDRPRRNNRPNEEVGEDENQDDRSINRPRRGTQNRDPGDVNPFARADQTNEGLGGVKLKIPTFDGEPRNEGLVPIFEEHSDLDLEPAFDETLEPIYDDEHGHLDYPAYVALMLLGLVTKPLPRPFRLEWLNDTGEQYVREQVAVSLTIGRYEDEVLCNVLPMDACHILLGRPWQFDEKTIHDGYTNRHSFDHKRKKITLVPLSPAEVHQDQLQLKEIRDKEPKPSEPEVSPRNSNFFIKGSQVKKSLCSEQPFLLLVYKETLMASSSNIAPEIPSDLTDVLQEYSDVFPEKNPEGLPLVRDIEHQIDFVPGASLLNRPAYRTNPVETKELQRQIGEILEKGYIRESLSPCAVP